MCDGQMIKREVQRFFKESSNWKVAEERQQDGLLWEGIGIKKDKKNLISGSSKNQSISKKVKNN